MDIVLLFKAAAALVFTLLLIGGVSWALKKTMQRVQHHGTSSAGDLTVEEVKVLDVRHKLMVAAYKNKKYVLLLGHQVPAQVVDVIEEGSTTAVKGTKKTAAKSSAKG